VVLVGDGVPVGLGVIEVVLEGLGVMLGDGVGVSTSPPGPEGPPKSSVNVGDGVGVGQSPNIIVNVSEVFVQGVSHGKLLVEFSFDSDAVVPPSDVDPRIHLFNAHLI